MSASLGKSKQNFFGSVVIICGYDLSLLSAMCSPRYKICLILFFSLVFVNCFHLLFVLIILKTWLKVCLELIFLIPFLKNTYEGVYFSVESDFEEALKYPLAKIQPSLYHADGTNTNSHFDPFPLLILLHHLVFLYTIHYSYFH